MLQNILWISLGAVLGALARFALTHLSSELSHHHGFPYGTLAVNVLGCFAVGYVLTWTADHDHDRWRLLAATGFCGAFTTFLRLRVRDHGLLARGTNGRSGAECRGQ